MILAITLAGTCIRTTDLVQHELFTDVEEFNTTSKQYKTDNNLVGKSSSNLFVYVWLCEMPIHTHVSL